MKSTLHFFATLVVIFFSTGISSAQKINNIDLDEIKRVTTDSGSVHFYDKLLPHFLTADNVLAPEDYQLIYFGYIYSSYFSAFDGGDDEQKFSDLYQKNKFEKAIPIGEKMLEHAPLDLRMTYMVGVCYYSMGDSVKAKIFAGRYYAMLDVIYKTGDGKSAKTAYVVTSVADEYEVMNDLNVRSISQSLIGDCDMIDLETPNDLNRDKIWFNTRIQLEEEEKMFTK